MIWNVIVFFSDSLIRIKDLMWFGFTGLIIALPKKNLLALKKEIRFLNKSNIQILSFWIHVTLGVFFFFFFKRKFQRMVFASNDNF